MEKSKEIVRLQFDVRRAQVDMLDSLVKDCGINSRVELFGNSISLMKWAVRETQKGRRIASYDLEKNEIETKNKKTIHFQKKYRIKASHEQKKPKSKKLP